jgi:hypothetical protein
VADSGSRDRRYSDEEFALILRKASKLQTDDPERALSTGEHPADGLSLSEIQSIAEEAGIDARRVAEAAATLSTEAAGTAARIFGGATRYHLEYVRKGEVTDEDLSRIVDVIRREAKQQGDASRVLNSLEWKMMGDVSQIYVNVIPRDGETSVQIVADRSGAGMLTYLFPGIAAFVSIGGIGAAIEPSTVLGVMGLIGACTGSAFLVARTIWSASTRSFRRRLSALMDATSGAVNDALTPPDYMKEPPREIPPHRDTDD